MKRIIISAALAVVAVAMAAVIVIAGPKSIGGMVEGIDLAGREGND